MITLNFATADENDNDAFKTIKSIINDHQKNVTVKSSEYCFI